MRRWFRPVWADSTGNDQLNGGINPSFVTQTIVLDAARGIDKVTNFQDGTDLIAFQSTARD